MFLANKLSENWTSVGGDNSAQKLGRKFIENLEIPSILLIYTDVYKPSSSRTTAVDARFHRVNFMEISRIL